MHDQVVMLALALALGAILMVPLFGLVRRLGKSWWVWGALLGGGHSPTSQTPSAADLAGQG
ncbi:MAG TPA: hypothetical protein VEI52_18625 [Terriglobales bacterium]|nr:hypothetical protein [Terriglobales bacterium]